MPATEFVLKNDAGNVVINEEVVLSIAGYTAVECAGIVAMASKRASDGLVELLGRENLKKGIKVNLSPEGAQIDLFIIVEYGVSIATVAQNVVESVKYRVETLAGVPVKSVNVRVEGIHV